MKNNFFKIMFQNSKSNERNWFDEDLIFFFLKTFSMVYILLGGMEKKTQMRLNIISHKILVEKKVSFYL